MSDRPPVLARIYVAVVTAVGLVLLAWCATRAPALLDEDLVVVGLLVLAVVVGEQLPIRTGDGGEVTPSTTFTVALLIAFGPAAAALAQAIASTIGDVRNGKPPAKIAFNVAQYAIALTAAGAVLEALTDIGHPVEFAPHDLVGMVIAVGCFFLLNTAAVSMVIALNERTSFRRQLGGDMTYHSVTEMTLLGLSPIAVLTLEHSAALAPLLVLPLLAVHRSGHQAVLNTHLAGHDTLTGLPNRMLFQDRTDQALEVAGRDDDFIAVMLLDLDRFKEINDTLGHHAGDAVLVEVSRRLQGGLRRGDTVARLGGDEFSVLVRSVPTAQDAVVLAERLRALVLQPIELEGLRLSPDVSIGVAHAPEHGTDVQGLMQRADIAMYAAKRTRAGVATYAPEQDAHSVERLGLMDELREALDRDDVGVAFQPQIDLATGACVGVEALVRWEHPEQGLVSPDAFIPLAEETGAIVPLTWHVLDRAARAAAQWRADGVDLHVAVNLSARVLAREDLASHVVATCRRHELPPQRLVLEVTESMVLHDPALAARTLEQLAGLGFVVSIDDFGTGFSSLDHLKRLPVGEVKIDRAFITSMHADERDRSIVRSTIDLAHALGMRVVAEGVEDAALADDLREMGCELAQGWHFAPALPADEIPAVVARLEPPVLAV